MPCEQRRLRHVQASIHIARCVHSFPWRPANTRGWSIPTNLCPLCLLRAQGRYALCGHEECGSSEMKPTTVQQLLAQEAYREHGPFLKGIRLKVTSVVVGTGSQPYQPVYDRGQRANEQEDCPALGVAAARILQAKAPPAPFAVAEGFLNLHPQRVQLHDALCRPVRVRQRSGDEPRVFVQLARA